MEKNNKLYNKIMEDINNESKETKESTTKEKEKEPEDSKRKAEPQPNSNDDNKIITDEEISKTIKELVPKEITNQILNFSNELDNILSSINATWENFNQGFEEYYNKEIFPKIQELINYPCITALQDKVILIFRFLCKYFLSRQNFLKIIPNKEIVGMSMILSETSNIFLISPVFGVNGQNYELIDDKYFYMVFKELLPEKEIENYYGNLRTNCMYKYLVEFLFQCGFLDAYIDNLLTRKDSISPTAFIQMNYFPISVLKYCEKDFLLKKNYNIRIIKYFNENVNYILSKDSEFLKNEKEMNSVTMIFSNYNIEFLFSTFSTILDELLLNSKEECQIFSINVFRFIEIFLKNQKLAIKTIGMQYCSYICNFYNNFYKSFNYYNQRFNESVKIYAFITQNTALYLKKINIFEIIFGENIHEALIQRSYEVLNFLYKNKLFSSEQIKILWNLSQTKYQSISNSIITLFGQLLPEFSNEDCNSILNIVSKMNYKDVSETTLKLLENFFNGNERRELLLIILFNFSNELSYEQGLDKNIILKSREILVRLLFNKHYYNDLIMYIKSCISYINKFYLFDTYSSTLTRIFDEFDNFQKNQKNEAREIYKKIDSKIETFGMMISYLDEKYKLFPIYINSLISAIKLFKFFYVESVNIVNQFDQGNFEIEELLNIDSLLNSYKKFIKQNMNYHYNLNAENNEDENIMEIDLEASNNSINSNQNEIAINEMDYDNYLKSIMKDFTKFFKETFISNNVLPSIDDIKRNIYEKLKLTFEGLTYFNYMQKILRSFYITHFRANIHFKINYLNFLFIILQNSKDIPNNGWYYDLLSELFSSQTNANNNLNLLTDENLEYLVKENISKSDFKFLPLSAFKVLHLFCIYANQKNGNATYSPLMQKFIQINNLDNFYGFDLIMNFFLSTRNESIYKEAQSVLVNIIELTSKDTQNRQNLMNRIFNFIQSNKTQIGNNEEIKIGIIRNLQLISVINGMKINGNGFDEKNPQNMVQLTIKNFYFNSQTNSDNIFQIHLSKGMKIKNLKEYLINTYICTPNNLKNYNEQINYNNNALMSNLMDIKEEDNNTISTTRPTPDLQKTLNSIEDLKKEVYKTNIIIHYKNNVLKDDYTLADYKVENNDNLMILKGSGYLEEEYKLTDEKLNEGKEAAKTVFGEKICFTEEILKASIIKHKGDIEGSILYLTDPENITNLEKEIEEKKKEVDQVEDDIAPLEEDKINLLIEILENNNDEQISNNIWKLFSEIKYPDNIIKNIIGAQLANLLDQNMSNMILFLKILNSLVFNDNFCKFNKIKKEQKNNWISTFIKNEQIISQIFITLSVLNEKLKDNNKIFQILQIFINWFHKIILKISKILIEKGGLENILSAIKNLRDTNLGENNNSNSNSNSPKDDNEFQIVSKDEAFGFINILNNIKALELLYKIFKVAVFVDIKSKEKLYVIEDIFEILFLYLVIQPNKISEFSQMEKQNNDLINVICNEKELTIEKMTKNFINFLLKSTLLNDEKETDSENNLFNIFCLSFIQKVISGKIFNDNFYELLGTLLGLSTNKLIESLIEPLIVKLINNVFDLTSNFDPSDNLTKKKIMYDIYILFCCLKFYKKYLVESINKIASEEKKDFIQLLYNCLFDISHNKNKINPFKFHDNFLREYSFNLLNDLISSNANYLYELLPKVLSHHKKLNKNTQNNNETDVDVNFRLPSEKLIGLRNFGSTCYLNSLLQQFFMIPTFRQDLFNIFTIKLNDKEEYRYSVIYNMQITFQNLIAGCMSPYPPSRFIKSFLSAFNGEPIQFGIQQDSDEFLSILCDNLEKEAKTYGKENFLENSFKGKISNEILSLESEFPYYSQSEEPFYRIPLDLKGHKSLEDALDAYIKGEILEGENKYYVEKYKRKISIRKSCSIKKLGNEVIIHLKRFEFDFNTFTNKKLSDYLQFPLKINFKKWTRIFLRTGDNNINKELLNISEEEKDNLVDDNMEYILTGILVHGGSNLQSGHYYSFIMDQETGKWHQFNDRQISDFNIETDLEKECFGNPIDQNAQYGKTAYLLFYTKKKCFRNKELLDKINVNEFILNDVYNENIHFLNMNIYTNKFYSKFLKEFCNLGVNLLEDEIPTNIRDQGRMTMNKDLKKEENIYFKVLSVLKPDDDDNDSVEENEGDKNDITSTENFEQIYNKCTNEIEFILKQEKEKKITNKNAFSKKDIIKFYFNYIFGIAFQYMQNDSNLLCQSLESFNNILKENQGYSLWILKQIEKNINFFKDILFRYGTIDNQMNDLNQQIIEFFKITFDSIYNYEKEIAQIINDEIKYFSKDSNGKYIIAKEYKSIVLRLIKKLFCDNLEKSRMEYAKNSLYLMIFYNFVKSYPEASSICVNYLFTIISLITNNSLPDIKSKENPNYLMGSSNTYNVNCNYILIFNDIILNCVTPGMKSSNKYSPFFNKRKLQSQNDNYIDFSRYPQLPKDWEKMLSTQFFINYVLLNIFSKSREIICHLCFCDENVSVKILSLVNRFMREVNYVQHVERVFNNALSVFEIKDALEFIRVKSLFQIEDESNSNEINDDMEQNALFDFYYKERKNSTVFVLSMIFNIAKAIEKYGVIYTYFEKNKNKIDWVPYFIMEVQSDEKMKDSIMKSNILNEHPDIIQVINDKMVKKLNIENKMKAYES